MGRVKCDHIKRLITLSSFHFHLSFFSLPEGDKRVLKLLKEPAVWVNDKALPLAPSNSGKLVFFYLELKQICQTIDELCNSLKLTY